MARFHCGLVASNSTPSGDAVAPPGAAMGLGARLPAGAVMRVRRSPSRKRERMMMTARTTAATRSVPTTMPAMAPAVMPPLEEVGTMVTGVESVGLALSADTGGDTATDSTV